jgi:hypothetical protein
VQRRSKKQDPADRHENHCKESSQINHDVKVGWGSNAVNCRLLKA